MDGRLGPQDGHPARARCSTGAFAEDEDGPSKKTKRHIAKALSKKAKYLS